MYIRRTALTYNISESSLSFYVVGTCCDEMATRNLTGNYVIQLLATFLSLVSLLSVLAWVIKTDQNPTGGQVKENKL